MALTICLVVLCIAIPLLSKDRRGAVRTIGRTLVIVAALGGISLAGSYILVQQLDDNITYSGNTALMQAGGEVLQHLTSVVVRQLSIVFILYAVFGV